MTPEQTHHPRRLPTRSGSGSGSDRLVAFLAAALLLAAMPLAAQDSDPRAVALIERLELREHDVASRDLPGWTSPRRIVASPRIGADQLAMLRAVVPGVDIVALAQPGPTRTHSWPTRRRCWACATRTCCPQRRRCTGSRPSTSAWRAACRCPA